MLKYRSIFICLLIPLFVSNVNDGRFADPLIDPSKPSQSLNLSDYSTITSPLNVTEYANRTDAAQSVILRYNSTSSTTTNGSASAVLPPNWEGNQISVNLYDIYENRTWNLNPL